MRALRINFAPKWRLPVSAWYWTSALFVGVAAQQGAAAWRAEQQTRMLETRVALLQASTGQVEARMREAQTRLKQAAPYARDALVISRCAAFPAESVLSKLESAQIGGMKLTSLDATPTDGTVRAEVEFNNAAALLHYLQALNDGEARPEWRLVEERLGAPGAAGTAVLSRG